MLARTLKQVNKSIKEQVGDVFLIKGKGYFYVSSDNDELALHLASLPSTSIYVCHINQQSVQDWVDDVKDIVGECSF